MSLQWWQEVIQTRHHVIWAGMSVMYVCLSAQRMGLLSWAGWLLCLTGVSQFLEMT